NNNSVPIARITTLLSLLSVHFPAPHPRLTGAPSLLKPYPLPNFSVLRIPSTAPRIPSRLARGQFPGCDRLSPNPQPRSRLGHRVPRASRFREFGASWLLRCK